MQPDEIKVGTYYRNNNYAKDQTWIGAGLRVQWEGTHENSNSHFTNKCLVCVIGESEYVGQMAQPPDCAVEGFWEGFYEVT